MSHFLTYVIGEDAEMQLALYDRNLDVKRHRHYLAGRSVANMLEFHGVKEAEKLLPHMGEWFDVPSGIDEHGLYIVTSKNEVAKWDWWIMGGRWHGYLKLKPYAIGFLGKTGHMGSGRIREGGHESSLDDNLPFGDRSADQARLGDIDWQGMREALATEAKEDWVEYLDDLERYGEVAAMWHSTRHDITWEEFAEQRSSVAPFAYVLDTDWHAKDDVSWWGVSIDGPTDNSWEEHFERLLATLPPETMITVADCHLGPED